MPKQFVDASVFDSEFSQRAEELLALRRKQSEIEEQIQKIRSWLASYMRDMNCEAAKGARFRITLSERETRRINPERLVSMGVDPIIIDRATEVTRYQVLDVREERQ